jgi:hypothetical protein
MVDLLSDDELKVFSGTDSSLARSYKEYAADLDEDSDEYYNDE